MQENCEHNWQEADEHRVWDRDSNGETIERSTFLWQCANCDAHKFTDMYPDDENFDTAKILDTDELNQLIDMLF